MPRFFFLFPSASRLKAAIILRMSMMGQDRTSASETPSAFAKSALSSAGPLTEPLPLGLLRPPVDLPHQ